MLTIFCSFLMILHLQTTCCHTTENSILLDVAEGENVLLPINQTYVSEISWILHDNHIATTKPEIPIEIKNRKLRGLLNSTADGSLTITNVTRRNQGTYTANIFRRKGNDCIWRYRLNVYAKLSDQDIDISVNVTRNETCKMTVTCTANGSDVKIFWSNTSDNDTIVTTRTLDLYEIHPSIVYKCIAENPVSRVSKTLTPWSHCQEDTAISQVQTSHGSLTPWCILIAIIIGVIIVTLVVRKRKKKLATVLPIPEIITVETLTGPDSSRKSPTIYAEIVKQDRKLAAISSGPRYQEDDLPIAMICHNTGQTQTTD